MSLVPHHQAAVPEPMHVLLWADVQGAGAEQLAYAAARRNQQLALLQTPATNGNLSGHPVNVDRADRPSMQVIATPLKLRELAPPAPVANTALSHLPGRLPPTVWDGEPSAAAPTNLSY